MLKELWPKGLLTYLVRHPRDIAVVIGSAWAVRRRKWWRTKPFLPVPDSSYWQFRMSTAFGVDRGDVTPSEVVAAARWSRLERRRR